MERVNAGEFRNASFIETHKKFDVRHQREEISFETRELVPGLRACHHDKVDFGADLVRLHGPAKVLREWLGANLPPAVERLTAEQLESLRLAQVRPRVDAEVTLEANPLEIGLIEALPRGKGCYPGQEVIERTISLGAPARRLVLIRGQGSAPVHGSAVLSSEAPGAGVTIGTVTSAQADGNGFQALALIRKSSASEGSDVVIGNAKGVIAKLAPLPSVDD